ncbi:ParA family protein [Pseudobacteriovorax antillogorgiicola]|uniref:Chromosome partitioning protein n=1 Tax=Pseudobacteriovorax antillogorgiicola TaxID=1513793 RepID=A0A1Y6CVL8_9BACT|nr:ParA family protein [Pseudobacteriovorax antillogorgiicola]TCS44212.1 chromosome partitioning protein [Pseudobacteriovorax antillogorgiicola]SMF80439.1 chromosome partitioning protein [Pseudobacteriovorax antillogorgiicola]
MKTSIIAITNQKGGVGKTATTVNGAAAFTEIGLKVLLIDLDYQANATSYLGLKHKAKQKGRTASQALLKDLPLDRVVSTTSNPNLDVIAGDMGLSKLSREKILDPGAAMLLKQWLESNSISKYDIILIDTHPSLDLLFQMAMTASHYYLVPMFAEADPFDGLEYMFNEISQIKMGLNKQLFFLGLVITKFDKANATHKKFLSLLEDFCKEHKIKIRGIIPDSKAVASSSSLQKPLVWSNPKLPIAKSHIQLARELKPEMKGVRMGRTQKTPAIVETPEHIVALFDEEPVSRNVEVF